MFSSHFDVISTHKKFTWTDFGGIYTHIPPVATPLLAPGGSGHSAATKRILVHLEVKMNRFMGQISSIINRHDLRYCLRLVLRLH